jgi:exodeoxyribonuclease VII large subunit
MSYLSLFELNQLLQETISRQMESSYWVVAEIGEMRLTQKGHCYLELVEKDDQRMLAKMRATLWSYNYRRLSGWFETITGESLRAGMKVLCQVEYNFHQVYGLSLNVKDIDANFTLGERARKKQEVLSQLDGEGVLEMNKSLPLPLVPQRIAVISSPTAAGLGDFIDQLENNRYGYQFDVRLFKALMQGEQAVHSLTQAMVTVFDQQEKHGNAFDMLVIIRGGGAQVDLDCFDSYEVGAHIAQFPIPVVTGIGHERDETVADLVAHTRMKTPTAVAEFLISGINSFEEKLQGLWRRMTQVGKHIVSARSYEMEGLVQQLRFAVFRNLQTERNQLRQLEQRTNYSSRRTLRENGEVIGQLHHKLRTETTKLIRRQGEKLEQVERYVRASAPDQILKKGFSYTTVNGNLISPDVILQADDKIETLTYHQHLISRLEKIEERKKDNESQKEK